MDGEWQKWTYGTDIRGWTLECGRFTADVRQVGGGAYFLTLNRHPMMNTPVLEEALDYAEREIVARVERVLPAYRIIGADNECIHGAGESRAAPRVGLLSPARKQGTRLSELYCEMSLMKRNNPLGGLRRKKFLRASGYSQMNHTRCPIDGRVRM